MPEKQKTQGEENKKPSAGNPETLDVDVDVDVDIGVGVDVDVDVDVEEKGAAKPPARPRFVPPTEAEVRDYCREKGYAVDPEAFVAFYASKGWKVGSAPMKDWKMALVTWQKRDGGAQSNDPWKRRTPDLRTQAEKTTEYQDQFNAMQAAAQWGGGDG